MKEYFDVTYLTLKYMKIKIKVFKILKNFWTWMYFKIIQIFKFFGKGWKFIKVKFNKVKLWIIHLIRITLFKMYWSKKMIILKEIFKVIACVLFYTVTLVILTLIFAHYDLLNLKEFIINEHSVDFASIMLTLIGLFGTIMAIVFSLSVLAVQKSSDSFSSRYIRKFIRDWREHSIYFIFTLSIIGLLYLTFKPELYNTNILYFSYLSLISLFFLLILVWIQHQTVTKKIDPYYAIATLAKESHNRIEDIEVYSKQLSALNSSSQDHTIAMKALIFQYNFNPLENRIKDLYSISMRLSDKGDIETVNFGFDAIKKILLAYFNAMKDSTFVYLSEHGLLAFDAHGNNFLAHLYEKFEAAGTKFIDIKAWDNARTIVDIYYELCLATATIKPALSKSGALLNENPTFNLTRGYFTKFIEVAIGKKDIEIVFKATQVLEPIMKVTIDNNLQTQYSLLLETVRKLLIYDIVNNINLLPDYCIDIYINSIKHIVFSNNKKLGYYFLIILFDELKEVFQILPNDAKIKWLVAIQPTAIEISPEKHSDYADNIVAFFEQLYQFFREQFISKKITSNFHLVAQVLEYVILAIQRFEAHENYTEYKPSLNNLIRNYIQLPVIFFGFIKGEDLSNGKMSDRLVNVVYKNMQKHFKDDKELLKSCAKSIENILNYLYGKEKYDACYDLPRIALRLVYLGTLAKKYNFNELADDIVLKLYKFEYQYVKKYFSHLTADERESLAHEIDRLPLAIGHWRDVVRGWKQNERIFYEEDGMTYDVTMEDIDDFIYYVWGYFFQDSHIAEHIERKQLIKRLMIVLNQLMNSES